MSKNSSESNYLDKNKLIGKKKKILLTGSSISEEQIKYVEAGDIDLNEGFEIDTKSEILDSHHDINLYGSYINEKEEVLPARQKTNSGENMKKIDSVVIANSPNKSPENKRGDIKSLKQNYGIGFSFQSLVRKFSLFAVILMIISIVFISGATAWAVTQYQDAPNISEGILFDIEESSVVYARDGKTKIFEFFKNGKREYVTLDRIPESLQLAVLSLEDQNFYYNPDGIPWSNIIGKMIDCAFSLANNCAGGSGISQQLVKNVQDDRENSIDRKIRELFTAIKLYQEGTNQNGKRVNKSDILELYLNWVPFSRNSFGAQMASKSYFGHDVDAREDPNDPNSPYLLSPPKACFLAALVQQQSAFNVAINDKTSPKFKEFVERKNFCLEKLAGNGENFNIRGDGREMFIKTEEELEMWQNVEVEFVQPVTEDPYPHFREYVQLEIVDFLNSIGLSEKDLYRRGLKIVTSLDPKIQRETEEAVASYKPLIVGSGGDNAASIVLDGPTGQILAMVGSLDYNDDTIKGKNNILTTPQQPGSSMKPYTYAMAFEKGFNPGTIVGDVRTTFVDPQIPADPFSPINFGNVYKGNVSLRYGLLNSKNITAIKAGLLGSGPGNANMKQGLENFFGFVEKIGVRQSCVPGSVIGKEDCSILPETGAEAQYRSRCYGPSFIGSCELDAVSHATGINTLLQEGNLRTASPFISIVDKFGQELYTADNRNKLYPNEDAKLNPLVARQIANVMADQVRPEFGTYTKFFTIPGWNLAGKTGTTNGNRDTWMVGGSPLYTTVVWAGRTDNGEMFNNVQASNLAAPIWQSIQANLHRDKSPVEFSVEGLIPVRMSGGRIVTYGGRVEYLSQEQINILNEFGSKVSTPVYNPKLENFYDGKNVPLIDKNYNQPLPASLSSSSSSKSSIEKSESFSSQAPSSTSSSLVNEAQPSINSSSSEILDQNEPSLNDSQN